MKLTDDLKKNVEIIEKKLNVGKTFDMLTRIIDVHNTKFYLYYLNQAYLSPCRGSCKTTGHIPPSIRSAANNPNLFKLQIKLYN